MNQDIIVFAFIILILAGCVWSKYFDDSFELKCVVSTVDGNKYCVRETARIQDSADLLAKVTEKCKKLVAYINEKEPNDERVQRLVQNYNPQKVMETLPTSEYTAYSENKSTPTVIRSMSGAITQRSSANASSIRGGRSRGSLMR